MSCSEFRVALVGGDGRVDLPMPPNVRLDRFGSARDGGNPGIDAVLRSIATGGPDAVVLLVRWLGHSVSRRIRAACKRAGIPCIVVPGGGSAAARAVANLATKACR